MANRFLVQFAIFPPVKYDIYSVAYQVRVILNTSTGPTRAHQISLRINIRRCWFPFVPIRVKYLVNIFVAIVSHEDGSAELCGSVRCACVHACIYASIVFYFHLLFIGEIMEYN